MVDNSSRPLVRLKVIEGPNKGRKFAFDQQDTFTLGRSSQCSCVVRDDPTFSRHHLLLEINQANVTLVDLGSLNGTEINGIRYGERKASKRPHDKGGREQIALRNGDCIKAGNVVMTILIDTAPHCLKCGREIPRVEGRDQESGQGPYFCPQCLGKEAVEKQPSPRVESEMAEVHLGDRYRQLAAQDPDAALGSLYEALCEYLVDEHEPPQIPEYRELQEIGRGGFGAVYRAERVSDGRVVALKTMLQTRMPPPRQLEMFEREKRIGQQLCHPNILTARDGGVLEDIHYFEMDYVDGGCAYRRMQSGSGRFTLDEATPIMLGVLAGLAHAHQAELTTDTKTGKETIRGVVHRDLKPSNILLAEKDGEMVPMIGDFGLAKAFASAGFTQGSITQDAGPFCGSPPYMAREHIINYRYVLPVTDVFEAAATFFHMLTGMTVWAVEQGGDIFRTILEGEPRRLKDCLPSAPRRLCEVFDQALELKADARFKDADEFLEALRSAS